MYKIEKGSHLLSFDDTRLEPVRVDECMVGFCQSCEGELVSLAYYRTQDEWMVAAQCRDCHEKILIRYDSSWCWLGDFELGEVGPSSRVVGISSLSREQLDAVFTPAEIRDMIACEKGEPYTRQNLYRARSKYEKFEKLFGVRIDV